MGRLLGREAWVSKQQAAAQENAGNFSLLAEQKIKISSGRSEIRLGSAAGTMGGRNHVIISHLRGRKPAVVNWNVSGGIL